MRHDGCDGDHTVLAEAYLRAAEEDERTARILEPFVEEVPHNICMMVSRACEKYLKAKSMYLNGRTRNVHDLLELVDSLGDIPDRRDAMRAASVLDDYPTQANYPSRTRDRIGVGEATRALELMDRLVSIIDPRDPRVHGEVLMDRFCVCSQRSCINRVQEYKC